MSDTSISDFAKAEGAANKFKDGIEKLKIAQNEVNSNPFSGLTNNDPDLAGRYLNQFKEGLDAVINLSLKKQENIAAFIEKNKPQDNGEAPPAADETPNNPNNPTPDGPNTPAGPGITPPETGDPDAPPEVEEPEVEEPELEEVNIDTSCLRDLPLKDIDGVVDTILGLCEDKKMYLDEYLDCDEYSDELKEALLKSEFIPDELKEQLLNADSKVVRKLIQSIMRGDFPEIFELNPLNIGAAYAYLQRCASELGISVEDLLLNEEYADVLREKLKNFNGVVDFCKSIDDLSANDYQDKMLGVWDGSNIEGMQDSTVDIIRDYLTYVAEQVSDSSQTVTPEELLSNRDYAEVLKEATQQFAKSCVFLNAGGALSNAGLKETVGGLFTGKNAKAMGMDSNSQKKFKEELDALAKEKGVSTEKLLTDSQYAEDVRDLLNKSENAKEIGAIYSKEEATVSQGVAKNLYENDIKNDTSVFQYKPEEEGQNPEDSGQDVDVPTSGTPATDTDVPATDVDVPAGDTDVPSGDTDVPAGDVDVPVGDTDVPSGDVDVPVTETQPETQVPIGDTDVSLDDIPVGDTDVPTTDTEVPTVETEVPTVDTDVPIEDVPTEDVPTTDTDVPTVETEVPTVDTDVPIEDVPTEDVPTEDIDVPTA